MNPIFQGLFPVIPKKSGILPKPCDFPSIFKDSSRKTSFFGTSETILYMGKPPENCLVVFCSFPSIFLLGTDFCTARYALPGSEIIMEAYYV